MGGCVDTMTSEICVMLYDHVNTVQITKRVIKLFCSNIPLYFNTFPNTEKSGENCYGICLTRLWSMFPVSFYLPLPKSISKPLVFWCFQGIENGSIGQKWNKITDETWYQAIQTVIKIYKMKIFRYCKVFRQHCGGMPSFRLPHPIPPGMKTLDCCDECCTESVHTF